MIPFKLPPQIWRLVLVALAIVGSYLVARSFLVQSDFGQYGFYRGDALGEIANSHEPLFAGRKACAERYPEISKNLSGGAHKTLSCEGCHGVILLQSDKQESLKIMDVAGLCVRCHEFNLARPAMQKQILAKDHYGPNCMECHLPHDPAKSP